MNTRDTGLNHTNGKGSKTRVTNVKAFRENYAEINWHREVTCQCQRCLQPVSSLEQHCHRPLWDSLCLACYTIITKI